MDCCECSGVAVRGLPLWATALSDAIKYEAVARSAVFFCFGFVFGDCITSNCLLNTLAPPPPPYLICVSPLPLLPTIELLRGS